jgi:hypothetical protein
MLDLHQPNTQQQIAFPFLCSTIIGGSHIGKYKFASKPKSQPETINAPQPRILSSASNANSRSYPYSYRDVNRKAGACLDFEGKTNIC